MNCFRTEAKLAELLFYLIYNNLCRLQIWTFQAEYTNRALFLSAAKRYLFTLSVEDNYIFAKGEQMIYFRCKLFSSNPSKDWVCLIWAAGKGVPVHLVCCTKRRQVYSTLFLMNNHRPRNHILTTGGIGSKVEKNDKLIYRWKVSCEYMYFVIGSICQHHFREKADVTIKVKKTQLENCFDVWRMRKESMMWDVDMYIGLIRLEANNSSAHLFQLRKQRNCTEFSTWNLVCNGWQMNVKRITCFIKSKKKYIKSKKNSHLPQPSEKTQRKLNTTVNIPVVGKRIPVVGKRIEEKHNYWQ